MSKEDFQNMSIFQHISELRERLLSSFVVVFIFSACCYVFTPELFSFFTVPFDLKFTEGQLIGTGPAEAFMLKIKLAFFAGVVFAVPWLFLQFWLFVSPGLYDNEKKFMLPFVLASSVLFFIGAVFSYKLVLPVAYEFFQGQYSSIGITPTIMISKHLTMVIKLILAFGFVFELPIVSIVLARAGLLTSEMMKTNWRYYFVVVFLLAAIFTPPDVFSQFLMAIPMIFLYVISILLVQMFEREEEAKASEAT